MEIIKCPKCNTEVDTLSYMVIGQAMCPKCGEIINLLTSMGDKKNEKRNY